MKILKTANYKKTEKVAFNSKKDIALKLLEWHGGQWSPLYSVGSTWLAGKEVPPDIIEDAIKELEDIVQKKVNYPDTITEEDILEVQGLQNELKKEIANISDYPTDTPMGLEDDYPLEAKSKENKIAGKKEKGKRDGTGPFEDSFQNKKHKKGKRKRKIAQARPNPLDGKSNQQARNIVNKKVIPQEQIKGFFTDDSWQGIQQIWKAFDGAGLDWNIAGSDYYPSHDGNPMGGKIWKIEINFINNKGKPTILYGTVTAAGSGTMEDPLSRYDITAYVG